MLLLAFVLYLPLVFFGYGSDNDTYGSLDAGRRVLQGMSYEPSRTPGYLIDEVSWALLSKVGGSPTAGSILSNLVTILFALLTLVGFQRICEHFAIPNRRLLTLILIVQPVFWVNAGCTMDYLWALGPLLLAFVMLSRGSLLLAALLSAFAIGARFTSGFAIAIFFLHFWITTPALRHRLLGIYAPITIGLGLLCFVPSLRWAHCTLAILHPYVGDKSLWTLKLRTGRWVYKNIYFWGLPATLLLGFMTIIASRKTSGLYLPRYRLALLLSGAMVLAHEILFFAFPIERAYMLPMLPFAMLLIGIAFHDQPAWLWTLFASIFAFNFVNLNIARPENAGRATGGHAGLWIERGYLIDDLQQRILLRGCDSMDCYNQRMLPHTNDPNPNPPRNLTTD